MTKHVHAKCMTALHRHQSHGRVPCLYACRGFANTLLRWERIRNASNIGGLVDQGYSYKLSRPRQPDDAANVTGMITIAESETGVSISVMGGHCCAVRQQDEVSSVACQVRTHLARYVF